MKRTSARAILSALVAAALAGGGAFAAERGHEVIVPKEWEKPYNEFHYAPAVRAGDFLILSGVVAGFREGSNDTDEEASYVRAFEAIGRILKEADAGWENVVEIQTFHTDLPAQIALFGTVKDRYLKEPWPAWTAIDIDRLFPDGGLVEIKITAYVGK